MLATASPAAADTLVVQPDGKMILTGRTWPEYGAIARLQPNGALDPSFGQAGFVIDRRSPGVRSLALQNDGRIVGGVVGGSLLTRYLPDGTPDPRFAGGGLGGTQVRDQPHFLYEEYGPAAVLVQPSGTITVLENRSLGAGNAEAWVRRYDSSGGLLETVGHIPPQGGPTSSVDVVDLAEGADGDLVGAGSIYGFENHRFLSRPLLARFLPGAGFDPSFGGGSGLVRPRSPEEGSFPPEFKAIAQAGDKLVAVGGSGTTFLVARFSRDGHLDSSFGEGGFAAPVIVGPSQSAVPGSLRLKSWAEDVAVAADGDTLLGGGTDQWGTWTPSKSFFECRDCPQPMLARLDSSGRLDPSFGEGGLLHLLKPDGAIFEGRIEQVTVLADEKILVKGTLSTPGHGISFVARLNPDGSYDRDFGSEGLAVVEFPCAFQAKDRQGCVPSASLELGLHGLSSGRPAISLRTAPDVPWATVGTVTLYLPPGVRPAARFRSRVRVIADGTLASTSKVRVVRSKHRKQRTKLIVGRFGLARDLLVKLQVGSLRTDSSQWLRRRSMRLRVDVVLTRAALRDTIDTRKFARRVAERPGP